MKVGVTFCALLLAHSVSAQVRQGQQATDINITQYLGNAFSPSNPLPIQVTNTTVGTAVAVRCVTTNGSAFESCAGAGGSGGSGPTDTDDGFITSGQLAGLNIGLLHIWNSDTAQWDRAPGDGTGGLIVHVTSLPLGQQNSAASTPVVLASDQSAVEITGAVNVGLDSQADDGSIPAGNTGSTIIGLTHYYNGATWARWDRTVGLNAGSNAIGSITNTAFGITQTGTNNDVDANITNASIAVTGTFWQATQPVSFGALPAGTNNIGDVDVITLPSIPAGNNNIGDVDIATIPNITIGAAIPAGNNNIGDVDIATIPNITIGAAIPAGNNNIGDVDVVSLPANASVNLAQVAGTNTVNGGLAGSQSIGGTAGNNAAITQNPLVIGLEARSTTPTQATNGNQIRSAGDLAGNQFSVYPTPWTCNLQALVATLTQCQAAPSAGYSLYVTSIVATTTTTTAGTFAVRYGTGANCATAPIGVWPQPGGATPARVTTAPISTALPLQIGFGVTGFKVAAANAICVIGTATNTIDISISGYTAP